MAAIGGEFLDTESVSASSLVTVTILKFAVFEGAETNADAHAIVASHCDTQGANRNVDNAVDITSFTVLSE
ncbi:MAG: hypothetical protein IT289_03190 [Oligoflexia bacterium]|nr:hypothetical protein [Oligoflexia bacterium]